MIKAGCLVTLLLSLIIPLGSHRSATHSSFNRAFDEYGRICWEDEKARLDNFAIQLQNDNPTTLGHIIVYDGDHACRGEAVARAIRAKKYLVEYRKVEANRVLWRSGGYQRALMTTLVISPQGASIWPLEPSVSPAEVTFVGNCRGRVRPVKCYRE
jgi:hypothetical protein